MNKIDRIIQILLSQNFSRSFFYFYNAFIYEKLF